MQKEKQNLELRQPEIISWVSLENAYPPDNETVWLYNRHNGSVALGCHVWAGEDGGWLWALSNGTIYAENGKIVSECEFGDEYDFTDWCRLPCLP